MGMHKTTLKAAVSRYSGFFAQGDGEEATKKEIAKDPKGFTPEEINEIYDALVAGVEIDDNQGGEPNEGQGNEGENSANKTGEQSGPPGGSTNPPPPLAGGKVAESDQTKDALDPESLAEFVKSLTPEQASAFAVSINEHHGIAVPSGAPAEAKADAVQSFDIEPGVTYVTTQAVRDSKNFDNIFPVGTDVTDFGHARLTAMLQNGLIKKAE